MKKNNLLRFLVTTIIMLSSPISGSMYITTKISDKPLIFHTVLRHKKSHQKNLQHSNTKSIPTNVENSKPSNPHSICFVPSYDEAKNEYLFYKDLLKNTVQIKKNIPLQYWYNYKQALESYYDEIHLIQNDPTQKLLGKKILEKIKKTTKTIHLKKNQLDCKNEVNKQKKRITQKIEQNRKVSLEDLIAYQITLKAYIKILPNKAMKRAPQETFSMVGTKIDTIAKSLYANIKFNIHNYNTLELTTNRNKLTALQHYSLLMNRINNYNTINTLKKLIDAALTKKLQPLRIRSIKNKQSKFKRDLATDDGELSDNESYDN